MNNLTNRLFVEVILPLPLYSSYTYLIPENMEADVERGTRVLVQFGKSKFYTALVVDIHANPPADFTPKEISAVLDATPLVRYPQLNLWNWISQYYLCSAGEVFKAAVPTGLKPESETFVTLTPDANLLDPELKLTERQRQVMALLEESGRLKIYDIEKQLKIKNVTALISQLINLKIVEIDEKVVERYRAKKINYVRARFNFRDSDALHSAFQLVKRSPKQEKFLMVYLDLARRSDSDEDVQRNDLLEKGDATSAILKSMVDKGLFEVYSRSVNRFLSAGSSTGEGGILSPLSEAQLKCKDEIITQFKEKDVVLLKGVTGSGKTEIYTHLIDQTLKAGRQVLFLVPEISLTTQLTDRLRKVFGDRMLVYHSKFSDNERADVWKKLLKCSDPLLIVGVRSSVFLPFANLGLVIVDEEHEPSYKQYDPAPRYNARDTSIVLAGMHGAKVVLGSATPAVETFYKALNGKFGLSILSERFKGASLPEVEIIDMRKERKSHNVVGSFSFPLVNRTHEGLKMNKQTIFFQNRRGYAPLTICEECGWTPKCQYCDVSLVYHKHTNLLKCHYCGFSRQLPAVCPACGQNSINNVGYGTERISEEASDLFKTARIARMDLDTTRNKDAYSNIISDFADHKTDILIGTQMVTKGLDFGNVTTVGVISADTILNFPDFRSNERAFNTLEQVAGRAGRRDENGKVFIQTSRPEEPVLEFVKHHDYDGFYKSEIEQRKMFGYPPFTKIINIYIKHRDSATVNQLAVEYALRLKDIFGERVLGPEKPFVSRVANWYLQTIMLKIEVSASISKVKEILRRVYIICSSDPRMKAAQIYYDVDPV